MGGPDDRPLGNLVKVHDKSSKSGIRQVYKFTKPSGDDRFFVASGTFKNKKDKDRLMRSLQERVALYATGDEEYRGAMGRIDSSTRAGEASGEVKIQPLDPQYKRMEEVQGAYPVPSYKKSTKEFIKGIGSGIKRGVIGEEVKDVYGQPQHSMSLLNVLKNFGDAFTMFNDINLPGERTGSGFDWRDEDMVAEARQRQSLFDRYQEAISGGLRQESTRAQGMLEEYVKTLRRGQGSARGQIR